VLQQINRDMPDQMVDPVQRLVQCVPERLGAGQADYQRAHQTRPDGHRDTVDFGQINVCRRAGALQRRHHGLEVRPASHFRYHAAKPHMFLDAGGHLVGKQLMAANNANAGLVAGGLDAQDKWAARSQV
jgi:hypothetical protein